MDKLKMETADMTIKNIERIAELFPNVITEMKDKDGNPKKGINFDLLKQELKDDVIDGEECYDFTWVGKRQAMIEANTPLNKTLRPCMEESKNWETTENLYIEGDNLEVLKLLQESYLNSIKMIYIDPPYNTGNDFIYNDNFSMKNDEYEEQIEYRDEDSNINFKQNNDSNPRFHSDWCSMLYPRLKLAHNLLTEDGVIFISIDDNEVDNLKKICNEVFGESNFITAIAWRRTDNQPNIGNMAKVKEYIICYAKNYTKLIFSKLPLTDKAKNEYRYKDDRGIFRRSILLDKTRGRHNYNVTTPSGKVLIGPWMIKEKDLLELDSNKGIYWTSGGEEQPYGKIYLHESKGQIPNDFWGIEFGTNQRASIEVEKLFNQRLFDFPKPVSLLKTLVTMGTNNKNDIVLDFFSGSATTAHAIMQLNAEDGGNRKFIMAQLPEACDDKSESFKSGYKNICEIGKERIRRAGDKIVKEMTESKKQLEIGKIEKTSIDIGFRVLKVDSTNMKDVYFAANQISQLGIDDMISNIKDDRTDLDLLYGVLLNWGLPLSLYHMTEKIDGVNVHTVDKNALVACFADKVSENIVREIAKRQPLRVVFQDSSFVSSSDKINLLEIFKQYLRCTEDEVKNRVKVI